MIIAQEAAAVKASAVAGVRLGVEVARAAEGDWVWRWRWQPGGGSGVEVGMAAAEAEGLGLRGQSTLAGADQVPARGKRALDGGLGGGSGGEGSRPADSCLGGAKGLGVEVVKAAEAESLGLKEQSTLAGADQVPARGKRALDGGLAGGSGGEGSRPVGPVWVVRRDWAWRW